VIAVDTSALIAIMKDEPEADACIAALQAETPLLISAGTIAEALIVAGRHGAAEKLASLFAGLEWTVIDVTAASAHRAADAYARWGKGVHPAGLNYGDCFSYEVARTHACPLLYVGRDFALTDVMSAL
jgi:ribonuclease VapC